MSNWKQRYELAHREWFKTNTPIAWNDGHYCQPIYPKILKANGLQSAISNYLNWTGNYCNRINVMGRLIERHEKQKESGNIITTKKFLPSMTRKGTADLHCIIKGKHVSIEIKIGGDTQSENQEREQQRIERAGGIYRVIKTIDEFFIFYDSL